MAPKKAYFLVKNNDYAPDSLIKLGQIITDLKAPHVRLSAPRQPLPEIHKAWETDYAREQRKSITFSPGVFTAFTAVIAGVGVDANGHFARSEVDKWRFEKLETEFIEPDNDYVNKSVEAEVVKEYLESHKLTGKTVYMVTGVKIARGARRLAGKIGKEVGAAVKVSMNAAMVTGAPIEAGPQASLVKKTGGDETFTACSDFVFAYRLRRITVRWSGKLQHEEATGGDLLGKNDGDLYDSEEEEEEEEDTLGDFEAAALDTDDYGSFQAPTDFTIASGEDAADGNDCSMLWAEAI